MLKQAFQDVLQADRLPKNLYAGLYRNMSLKVYQKNQEQYFQEIQDKKMLTNKVTTQGNCYVLTQKETSRPNYLQIRIQFYTLLHLC